VGPRRLSAPLLELAAVSKSFGGVHALVDVDLQVADREVHGLLGQNGSGKSTLLKVLAGFHAPDAGALAMRGEPVPLPLAPGEFRSLGMAFVHQDLGLVPALSVCENLMVSRLGAGGRGPIRWREERRRAAETLERHGLDGIDPGAPVGALTQMQRALLAIVRAVEELRAAEHERPLLVLDEPTAFLPRAGIERLFALVRALVDDGASVLFVTHDLDEVVEICDCVTVLRDGRRAGTVAMAGATADDLVELIIGRRLARRAEREAAVARGAVRLRADAVGGRVLEGVDVEVCGGEVLGVTGLVGSGFEELPHLLFGSREGRGRLELDGIALDLARLSPARAIAAGMALVPSDRPLDGVIGTLSVTDNVTMTAMQLGRLGLLRGRMRANARELGDRFGVTPNDPRLPLAALSGGNQQKVVLAKWLQHEPRLLLLDQPTQGVDVAARGQIFDAIRATAAAGAAVVCASADYEEVAALCDRLLIVARGRVVRSLERDELTKDRIAEQVLTSTTLPEPEVLAA
jgi:ribose transport system ATP-binding protein